MRTGLAGALVVLFVRAAAWSQDPVLQNTWAADGPVSAIAISDSVTYIGGFFNNVGRLTGPGAIVDMTTGKLVDPLPKFEGGGVHKAISDGANGWFVSGGFTQVGGQPRAGLVHILADHSIDPAWQPSLQVGGSVSEMVLNGNQLFVGGSFTSIDGQTRNHLAALNATNGSLLAWNPNSDGPILSMIFDTHTNRIYVGGQFHNVGGQARNFFASLDATNGSATTLNLNPSDFVYSLVLSESGDTLFVGGQFTNIGGLSRNNLAAVDPATGLVYTWNPGANSRVRALALSPSGNDIFVAGEFTTLGGAARNNAGSVSTQSGLVNAWNPQPDQPIDEFIFSGNIVYVSGNFRNVGGQQRNYLAALNSVTAVATSWDPFPDSETGVSTIANNGSQLFVGGSFRIIGGEHRTNLAAIDNFTGQATAWNPAANDFVYALELSNNTIYVGGQFTSIGGQARNRLALLNTTTGAVLAWNPNANGFVTSIDIGTGSIYIGGNFTAVGGVTRNHLASVAPISGILDVWNPNADGRVSDVMLRAGTLYVSGDFNNVGGRARKAIAALSATTGAATAWDAQANDRVLSMAADGDNIYVGGDVSQIGGQPRNRVAAISATTGLATSWNPNLSGALINSISLSGTTLYVGGVISNVGGAARGNLVGIDTGSGLPLTWDPHPNANIGIVRSGGTVLAAGGDFSRIANEDRRNYAQFSITAAAAPAPTLTSITPNSGPTTGGTSVRLTGTNFVANAQVSIDGRAATSIVVVSGVEITALTPTGLVGPREVRVTNPDTQSSALPNGFTYFVAPSSPVIATITPSTGSVTGGTTITIAGANFVTGATVLIDGNPATAVNVINPAALTAVVPVGVQGARDVKVTNPSGLSATKTGGFTYVSLSPTITSITPNQGPISGGTAITIVGTNFVSGISVRIDGNLCSFITVVDSTHLLATTPIGTLGSKDVLATTPDLQFALSPNGFTYIPATDAPPTIGSILPTFGSISGQTAIAITGTNFRAGANVVIGGNAATDIVVVSATKITAATPPGTPGLKNVQVINSDNQSATLQNGFTYLRPAPSLLSLAPISGPTAGGIQITLRGRDFFELVATSQKPAVRFGTHLVTASVQLISSEELRVTLPAGDVGVVDVEVINPDLQTGLLPQAFTYTDGQAPAQPVIQSVSPVSGPLAGGTLVTILGQNFQSGARVTFGSTGSSNVVVTDATRLTALAPPGGSAGPVAITVTNPDSNSATLNDGFSYVAAAPVVSSTIRVYPNPFRATARQTVTIEMPAGSTIKFFTPSGSLAREIQDSGTGITTWDVRNDGGETLASGLYLYQVQTPGGEKHTSQFVVIR